MNTHYQFPFFSTSISYASICKGNINIKPRVHFEMLSQQENYKKKIINVIINSHVIGKTNECIVSTMYVTNPMLFFICPILYTRRTVIVKKFK